MIRAMLLGGALALHIVCFCAAIPLTDVGTPERAAVLFMLVAPIVSCVICFTLGLDDGERR